MFTDKKVIITGSTSGIGLGIARFFSAQGASVCINGFGEASVIDEALQSLSGTEKMYHGANMLDVTAIEDLIMSVHQKWGRVDILVNNAGIQFVSPIEDFPPEKYDAIIGTGLSAAFHAIRFAVPIMKQQKWGRIINMGSAHAIVASPFKSAYVAAKHGLLGLTKAVALEVAEFGITCNAICPGYVRTPLVEGQISSTAKARNISEEAVVRDVLLAAQSTKKFIQIEEVAALAGFLSSDSAASITGAGLPIDGGWTAH